AGIAGHQTDLCGEGNDAHPRLNADIRRGRQRVQTQAGAASGSDGALALDGQVTGLFDPLTSEVGAVGPLEVVAKGQGGLQRADREVVKGAEGGAAYPGPARLLEGGVHDAAHQRVVDKQFQRVAQDLETEPALAY